ncbi:MAG: hypothetical protein MRY63_00580 [Neomegalonema sp.]|nr:hypothetical protein [Neomegalonema sp.]
MSNALNPRGQSSTSVQFRFERRSALTAEVVILKARMNMHTRRSRYHEMGRIALPSLEIIEPFGNDLTEAEQSFALEMAQKFLDQMLEERRKAFELLPITLSDLRIWINEAAASDEIEATADDVLFALQDLRSAIVAKLGQR